MSMVPARVSKTGLKGYGLGEQAAYFGTTQFSYSTNFGDVGNPQVGERWMVSIRNGPPNVPVSVYGSTGPNSGNRSETLEGYTDQYGNWRKTGQFTQDQIGSWSETWKAGGMVVGTWNFIVRSPIGQVPPAALLRPMPTITPHKPGQVSSGQLGPICALDGWVAANPFGGVLLALGIGWGLRSIFR